MQGFIEKTPLAKQFIKEDVEKRNYDNKRRNRKSTTHLHPYYR